MPGLIGESLDRYRLQEQVGQGGMATVFRSSDPRSGEPRAIKVLSPTIGSDKRFVRRFRREAELLARLKHPHIVPVLDYGEARGMVYLVMPFIEGETLHKKLVKRRYSEPEIRRWIHQVAEALAFAHARGVIHRDIKPSNVMVDRNGNAFLTDFGLARLTEGTGTLTGSLLMGTPAYVSPEQGRGELVDARSDQYSFGVILFQFVTGRLPFDGDTPMATVMMHLQEPPPPPRTINPKLPPAVETVILKCLAKEPIDRFASVSAAARAFEAALGGASAEELGLDAETIVRPAPVPSSAPRAKALPPARRSPAWLLIGALGVAGVGALVVLPGLAGRLSALGAATATLPGVLATRGVSAEPTSSPQPPTATPFRATSVDCPGVSLFGTAIEGNDVAWQIDNGTDQALTLIEMPDLQFPLPGPIRITLDDAIIWEGEPGSGSYFWEPDADRTIPPQTTERLAFRYQFQPEPTGYKLSVGFDVGCTIGDEW